MALLDWFRAGRDPAKHPKQEGDSATYMLAIHRSGKVERIESNGYGVVVEEPQFAEGSGRDFAMAALALGHDARTAVALAIRLTGSCGNGVDTLTFESP